VKHKLKQLWQHFRPVLTGWLAVALLLPTLLALTPSGAAASVANDLSQICMSQSDSQPADHQNHSQDCPCCLPGGVGFTALPPAEISVEVARVSPVTLTGLTVQAPIFVAQDGGDQTSARGPPRLAQ